MDIGVWFITSYLMGYTETVIFYMGRAVGARAGIFVLIFCTMLCVCAILFTSTARAEETKEERQARLEQELAEVERQIAAQQVLVSSKQTERRSLERDLAILDAQIKKAQLGIKARSIEIQQLGVQIGDKQITVNELTARSEKQRQSLAQLVRKTNEIDNYSLVEIVLSDTTLSRFFEDLENFHSIKASLQDSLLLMAEIKNMTLEEKASLEDKQQQEIELRKLQEVEKREIELREAEKEKLLKETRGQEAAYQATLRQQQQTAAQIRQMLFELRDTQGIQFGQAVEFAKAAAQKTGVRPALILAILSQESDLGKNVGQCLVTNIETGDGKGKNTGTPFPGTMKAPRDTVPFARITAALGISWSTTVVSCPQPGGYGGAMGPTQFIPSTWEMYEARLKSALGVTATNPWNASHAIMATGLYLQDVGAAGGSYIAEHTAAARYYAGGAWATSGQNYANQVMQKAANFQKNIDILDAN
jgi:membrane-bound lytic murein transglycosylase B